MARISIEEADEILDKEFRVLDKGFIRLIDYMGGDESIVQAARVSYGAGTKQISEDKKLIRYLMRNRHTTPFEMVELKFHIKLPIFVARQWIRHRTASVNEYSGRYSIMEDEFYVPEESTIKFQSSGNKQGRSDEDVPEDLQQKVINILIEGQEKSYEIYENFLDANIARELSRINLPISLYTQWYWKIDLHNLFHFLKLRMDVHAQHEIRAYATIIGNIVKKVVPVAWEAFEEYEMNSVSLSKKELLILKKIFGKIEIPADVPRLIGLQGRELNEFYGKIDAINRIQE